MRDIKFRFWDGIRLYNPGDTYISDEYGRNQKLELGITISGTPLILDHASYYPSITPHANFKRMEYIGRKDKNDKEIYEGDIVHINYDKFGEGKHEVWSLEYGCYGDPFKLYAYNQLNSCREVFIGEDTDNNMYFSEGQDEVRECIVRGNVYENPELLENNQ